MSGKKETYAYGFLKKRFALEWKTYAPAFGFILIADNIGQTKIPVGKGMFILFPIFYVIISGVLSGLQMLKIVDNRHVKAASRPVVVGICPFIAKLGITAGVNTDTILQSGPALLPHGLGNLLGLLLALPVAILLGTKRKVTNSCHSINREYHMTLINNIYGSDSAEVKGSLSIYTVGGMVGTIYFDLMASVAGMAGWFHLQALGPGPGVGTGVMMTSSSVSLCVIYPEWIDIILAMTSVGEAITGITGMYTTMFIAIPMTDKLYTILEPKLGRFALKNKEGRDIKEEAV